MIFIISGWKQSGKDTVAHYLVKNHGFKRIAFADILKDDVSDKYDVPREHLDDNQKKDQPIFSLPVLAKDPFAIQIHQILNGEFAAVDGENYWTPRALCILEGSVKRSVDPNYWVNAAIRKMKDQSQNYVISDARFKNEISSLEEAFPLSTVSIRIDRFDANTSQDPSETNLDSFQFKYRLNNKLSENKTLIDLYSQLEKILSIELAQTQEGSI